MIVLVCPFLELVVDFELASGQRITDDRYGDATPWYRKAEIIAKMFRMAL